MNDVKTLPASWSALYASKDYERLSALYSDDALFFGSTPDLVVGAAAVHKYFRGLPDMPTPGALFRDLVWQHINADVVNLAATVRFSAGEFGLDMRLTHSYVRRGADWKIVSHHASKL